MPNPIILAKYSAYITPTEDNYYTACLIASENIDPCFVSLNYKIIIPNNYFYLGILKNITNVS